MLHILSNATLMFVAIDFNLGVFTLCLSRQNWILFFKNFHKFEVIFVVTVNLAYQTSCEKTQLLMIQYFEVKKKISEFSFWIWATYVKSVKHSYEFTNCKKFLYLAKTQEILVLCVSA